MSNKKASFGLGLCNIHELLTPEELEALDRDLKEIADCRRQAEAESRDIYLG